MYSGKEDGMRWWWLLTVILALHSKDGMRLKARGWERSSRDSKQSAVLDHDK